MKINLARRFGLSLLFLFFSVFSAQAQVTKETVTAQGTGTTRDGAIAAALTNAAGQVFGIQLDSSTVFQSATDTSTKSVKNEEKSESVTERSRISSLNQHISQKVKTRDNTPILGYSVNSVKELPTKLWEASVTMTYSKYQQIGGDSSRRSVVVVAKDPKVKDVLINTVSQSLVTTRRFDVLTRQNSELFEQEKGFVVSSDAAQGELARLGQASGADYLVIAEIQSLSVSNNQRETIRMTGEVLVRSSASGILKLQIVEFSTRKVKWSGTEKFGGVYAGVTAVSNEILINLISSAADKLIEKMVESIYPIEVVKIMGGNVAIINRGDGVIKKGETYMVFIAGEEIKDKQSGESLGSVEIEVGTGKIIDVKPKFSYLKMDSGALDDKTEYIVRKTSLAQPKPKQAQPASSNKQNTGGGAKNNPYLMN